VQLDNQSTRDPIFPVILKETCTLEDSIDHDHSKMLPTFFFASKLRTDNPNVTYCTLVNFVLQELDLKIELKHVLTVYDYVFKLTEAAGSSLTIVHPVFRNHNQDMALTVET
jgi:hypothetical protein